MECQIAGKLNSHTENTDTDNTQQEVHFAYAVAKIACEIYKLLFRLKRHIRDIFFFKLRSYNNNGIGVKTMKNLEVYDRRSLMPLFKHFLVFNAHISVREFRIHLAF